MPKKIRAPVIAAPPVGSADGITEVRRQETLLKTGALQSAIFNSANFSSIATDAKGVIQIFNVGAERMLGYAAADVMNKITPADISDPQEVIARAKSLSVELATPITPGFEALVFKASRGIEDIYELTYIRKDGSRFPAVVSVTALRDERGGIIGYLLIGTDNTARKRAEEALLKAGALQSAIFNSANFSSIATDAKGVIQIFNVGAERMLGYTAADVMNKITPADISDPQELIARAKSLSVELATPITPGFEALVFKASRGIEDIYELTYIRKDGSRFPAVVSVTALREERGGIIGYLLIGTDNTARKRAEEALLKAGALQSAIFNSANFSSIATDAKGVIQIFNVGAERMLGYTAADVMNKITPADISDPQELIARAKSLSAELSTPITPGFEALVFKASRGIEDIYELTYIRKDGSRFPAVVSVTALRDAQGVIIGYLLIGTELKAGALQSAIFNSANFSSIATDAKGVIQIFNVGAERMLGYAAADVMNKITPADISDPQEVIARAKELSAELSTPITPGFEALVFKASRGIEDIYELTYIRKDGSRFPAVVSVTALRNASGTIIGYLLIGTDNTARKQVEAEQKLLDQRLRDQQFYTRSLIESNIDAIITTAPSGIITDVNKQMEALTGCTRDELIGAPFKDYFTDPERAEAGIKLVLSEKKVTNYELTARALDGKETVVSYNATTFYDRGRRLQGVFAAARDVTERKRLDQALESARSVAEKANLAKSDFLSSMSHELRSPLNAILGFTQLLDSDPLPPTPGQKLSIDQILRAGWHLLKLIDEILDLAKVESGQVPISLEPVSLTDVLLECRGMIEPQAQQQGVRLNFPQLDAPCLIRADRTRLKQVLINLLSNAIKYNTPGGEVIVECAEGAPDCTRISVKDTGAGLSPEKLTQLFQPFNRLGQESSGKEGTGIGLVVAKRLVELMEGAIGVESVVGSGSIFWFELKTAAEPELAGEDSGTAAAAQPHASRSARLHTVLYIEDNPANMMLVEKIIARHPDIRLLTAENGMSGIKIARDSQPEAILMDINLPGISGIQALNILREDPLTKHIPVIAISANAMPLDIEKGKKAKFFHYLTKPIKVDELMETLDRALEFCRKESEKGKEGARFS
jgi:PAS domain S-box-containing protein